MIKNLVLLCFFLLNLVSCATRSVSIDELDMSLVELYKIAIEALPLGKRSESINGREFYSVYFTVQKGEYEEARGAATRSYARISVLGDRRPYNIEVAVIVERKNSGGEYTQSGYDTSLARVISRRIQNVLYKRRDDRNIIDDFRVF